MADRVYEFPNEPAIHWSIDELNELLLWIVEHKASDIKLNPGQPVFMKRGKRWYPITRRRLNSGEIAELVDRAGRNSSLSSQILSGDDKDFSHEVRIDRFKSVRFRVNATGCSDGWVAGSTVTFRAIAEHPPTIEQLGLDRAFVESVIEQPGLVLVAGETGSGKSTLLGSILRHVNETYPWSIATFEDPIEYRLTGLPNAQGPVAQTQIGIHFDSFARAPRNSLRRNEDVILLGESRDRETVASILAFAETGPLCFSTIHTNSVAETPGRIIRMYPSEDQNNIAAYLVQALRMIIFQHLVEATDPETGQGNGLVAVREYIKIDAEAQRELEQTPPSQIRRTMERLMRSGKGVSLDQYAAGLHRDGLINQATFENLQLRRSGFLEEEAGNRGKEAEHAVA